MGCEELIQSLVRSSEEKRRLLWAEAEQEAAVLFSGLREHLAALRSACLEADAPVDANGTRALSDAAKEARKIALLSEHRLSQRLFSAARDALPHLRTDAYPEAFASLAAELPPLQWEEVIVNPSDPGLAVRHFPAARISADPEISGGFLARTHNGGIVVDNTFEKRLEQAWHEILPLIMKGLADAPSAHEASH